MPDHAAPLLEVFFELRQREFPLGVGEYLVLIEALARGYGIRSRKDLAFLCRTVWAKSLEEQARVDEVLDRMLPRVLTPEQLEGLQRRAIQERETHTPTAATPGSTTPADPGVPVRSAEGATGSAGGPLAAPAAVTDLNFQLGTAPPELSAPAPDLEVGRVGELYDLIGELPVSRRQMNRAWRYLRRMRRQGRPVELDVRATVDRAHRLGVLTGPVLVPARRNAAGLLILKDEGGSMTPFHRECDALIDSARHGGLGLSGVVYFRNAPGTVLFQDPKMDRPVRLDALARTYERCGVLVVSDAGAARGNRDVGRAGRTAGLLQALRRTNPTIAWLNPMPVDRWAGTTAAEVRARAGVPMFPFDPDGLYAAMDVLRGRGP